MRRTKIRSKRTCKTVYTNTGTSWPGSPRGSFLGRRTAHPAISTASAAGYAPSKPHRRSQRGKRVHGRMWKMPSEPMPKRAVRRRTNRNMHLAFCSRSRNSLTNAGVCVYSTGEQEQKRSKKIRECLPAGPAPCQPTPGIPLPEAPGCVSQGRVSTRSPSEFMLPSFTHVRSSSIQFGTPDADILPERKHTPLVFESRATTSLCQLVRRGNPSRCIV